MAKQKNGLLWKTAFYVKGDLNDGVLSGDLLIKGYGDPYLTTENVWKMLNRLKVEGVKKITGNLLIDDSYFLNPSYDPGEFDNEPLRSYNVGPNALMFNFRSVRFSVESSIEVPIGDSTLEVHLERDGTTGWAEISIDGQICGRAAWMSTRRISDRAHLLERCHL